MAAFQHFRNMMWGQRGYLQRRAKGDVARFGGPTATPSPVSDPPGDNFGDRRWLARALCSPLETDLLELAGLLLMEEQSKPVDIPEPRRRSAGAAQEPLCIGWTPEVPDSAQSQLRGGATARHWAARSREGGGGSIGASNMVAPTLAAAAAAVSALSASQDEVFEMDMDL